MIEYKVVVKKNIDMDHDGIIKKGTKGKLTMDGPAGWPVFKTTKDFYDIAMDKAELDKYFKFIAK